MAKDPPANAEDTGSTSGPSTTLRSLHSRAHKPQLLKPEPPRACAPPLQWEARASRSPQLGKPAPKRKPAAAAAAAAAAKSLQSCPTLWDPIDGSPPGSPIPGILQARILEWVAISFFNAWMWKVKVKSLSRVQLLVTPWTAAHQAPPSMGFSRQEDWSGVPLPSPNENLLQPKKVKLGSQHTKNQLEMAHRPPDVKSQLTGKDPDAGKDWRQEEKGTTEDEMVGCITDSMNVSLSKLWEMVKDRKAWFLAFSPNWFLQSQRVGHNWATEQYRPKHKTESINFLQGITGDYLFDFWSCACMLSRFSCVWLCVTPMDYSLPGSFVHGILQARILEWVAMLSSRGSSQPRDRTHVSSVYLYRQAGSLSWAPPRKPMIFG